MRLLVSVSDAAEAAQAIAGGADIVDAKDPRLGPLGAVTGDVFDTIARTVAGARPVTAALGDASDPDVLARTAGVFTGAGATFVKVGFAGIREERQLARLLEAAVCGTSRANAARGASTGVVAVAYADASRAASVAWNAIVPIAAAAGARGLLVDTFDKHGPGLPGLLSEQELRSCVTAAHEAGLIVALAGRLTARDLPLVLRSGADIAGVRGAACGGPRTGRIEAAHVRLLQSVCSRTD